MTGFGHGAAVHRSALVELLFGRKPGNRNDYAMMAKGAHVVMKKASREQDNGRLTSERPKGWEL